MQHPISIQLKLLPIKKVRCNFNGIYSFGVQRIGLRKINEGCYVVAVKSTCPFAAQLCLPERGVQLRHPPVSPVRLRPADPHRRLQAAGADGRPGHRLL